MSSPSEILNGLTDAERKSLAGLVAVALPADDLAEGQWSLTLLEDVLVFLDLDKELAEGFYPMTERARQSVRRRYGVSAKDVWEETVAPFRACLPPKGEHRLVTLRDLMVIVALHCGYDARTRIMFRRVCDAMEVEWHPRVSEVESTLARKVYERVTRERERELRGDRWRGFKIGAAMIGGGALLAVSGGLAAPAVAAGIAASGSIIGASAAATLSGFATTAWMATVFGATGAGLVGYKMDRRTKGVKEFVFESESSVGEEMCVSICVPGVLKDKADLQRGWGVEPRGPDVSAIERLRRFYYVYNREKVANVEDILTAYKGREASLCKRLEERYGADPRDPPTRNALAAAEGRSVEGVSKDAVARDAAAIGKLMEIVLSEENEQIKAAAKEAAKQEKKGSKGTSGETISVSETAPNTSRPISGARTERNRTEARTTKRQAPPFTPYGDPTEDLLGLLADPEDDMTSGANDAAPAQAARSDSAKMNADILEIFSGSSSSEMRIVSGTDRHGKSPPIDDTAAFITRPNVDGIPSVDNAAEEVDATVTILNTTDERHVGKESTAAPPATIPPRSDAKPPLQSVEVKEANNVNAGDAAADVNVEVRASSAVTREHGGGSLPSIGNEKSKIAENSDQMKVTTSDSTEPGIVQPSNSPTARIDVKNDISEPSSTGIPVAVLIVAPENTDGEMLRGWTIPKSDVIDADPVKGKATTSEGDSADASSEGPRGATVGKKAGKIASSIADKVSEARSKMKINHYEKPTDADDSEAGKSDAKAKRDDSEAGKSDAKAKRESIEIEAVQEGLHVLSFETSGAAGRVAEQFRESTKEAAKSYSGEDEHAEILWAQSALKRCDGDEDMAVNFVDRRTADEMQALVEQDFAEENARKEREKMDMHRVWFWQDTLPHTDQYVLRWESLMQIQLGKSVESVVKSVSSSALQQSLQYTTLAALMTALTWPLALITLANMIDADWTIGRQRADIAGKILADALLNREQGCRPVTLIGTSLGARLIFACLEEIARRHELWEEQTLSGVLDDEGVWGGKRTSDKLARVRNAIKRQNNGKSKAGLNGVGVAAGSADRGSRTSMPRGKDDDAKCAAGIIENVALLGAPLGASPARWERVARIIHGRLINGYSRSDLILGLVFRAKSLSLSVAGVQKVAATGVENIDLSTVVGSDHFNYNRRMPEILPLLALDDCSKYIQRGDYEPVDPSAGDDAAAKEQAFADSMVF